MEVHLFQVVSKELLCHVPIPIIPLNHKPRHTKTPLWKASVFKNRWGFRTPSSDNFAYWRIRLNENSFRQNDGPSTSYSYEPIGELSNL